MTGQYRGYYNNYNKDMSGSRYGGYGWKKGEDGTWEFSTNEKQTGTGGYFGYGWGSGGNSYGGYNGNTQYYNGYSSDDHDSKHPREWWKYLKKDQFDGMISAKKFDNSWKDKFESMYTRADIDHMSDDQKNKKIKDILDEQAKEKGD